MDYSQIIKAINSASAFDLFRIHSAIDRMLDDPQRITEVKQALRIGEEIEYFDQTENRAVKARVLAFKRTRVLVENSHDRRRWLIRYHAINIHKVDTRIAEGRKSQGLTRNEVAVGDAVGFMDRDNNERYGKVIKLNQKTVTMLCDGNQWRVSYGLLFKVLSPDVERLPSPGTV